MPKLVTVLREGYGWLDLRTDAISGLTVAIVALPLSMAIAISSGLSPDKGLFTAIVGGFLISALGGSRFQIGGPAGAFIVLIAGIVERHGYDGLVLATLLAGVMMIAAGFLRLGSYIKYIPYPVTIGFTAGIATIIFASQLKELLGLDIAHEPAALVPKLGAISAALPTINSQAIFISLVGIGVILGLRHVRPKWPGMLIAVAVTAGLTALLHLNIATIGSRFGALPHVLPWPSLPSFNLAKLGAALPDAASIALLGAIESLLSAMVADGMSGRRHRSNGELVAQGVANIAAVTFGGMCVTGTIARTATNVRSGARGPVSGMLHALYILLFMLVAAPLASHIPLAGLGAILAVVAWNMAERHEFASLVTASWGDAVVLLATFLLTIFVDLITGIGVGVTLGAFLMLHRMAETVEVNGGESEMETPIAAGSGKNGNGRIMVYRISGAFFFGATSRVSAVLGHMAERPEVFVLDLSEVPLIDSSAARTLKNLAERLRKSGTPVYLAGARPSVRQGLIIAGLRQPFVQFANNSAEALAIWRAAKSADLP